MSFKKWISLAALVFTATPLAAYWLLIHPRIAQAATAPLVLPPRDLAAESLATIPVQRTGKIETGCDPNRLFRVGVRFTYGKNDAAENQHAGYATIPPVLVRDGEVSILKDEAHTLWAPVSRTTPSGEVAEVQRQLTTGMQIEILAIALPEVAANTVLVDFTMQLSGKAEPSPRATGFWHIKNSARIVEQAQLGEPLTVQLHNSTIEVIITAAEEGDLLPALIP